MKSGFRHVVLVVAGPNDGGDLTGFDRLLMLRLGAAEIGEVLAFPLERA